VDSRLCISYHNIESRDGTPEPLRTAFGRLIFGCDICQDVCPWNSRAPFTTEPEFQPRETGSVLEELASLTEQEFRERFRRTPVYRARYAGFLRNVALAMGNAPREDYRRALENLALNPDSMVAEQARWSLKRLDEASECVQPPQPLPSVEVGVEAED
jgi:epoxyqueuosine reductase